MRMSSRSLVSAPLLAAAVLAVAASLSLTVPAAADSASSLSLVLPIVLSSGGAGGSFYTSELILTNRGNTLATLELRYTAAFGGGDGTATDTLLAGEQKVVPDAIAYLRDRGVPIPEGPGRGGTLRVTFAGLSGSDVAAATVRTTTATASPQPIGAAGLAYPGVPPTSGFTTSATLYGLRATEADRSNVAIYNPSSEMVTVRVTAFSGDGTGSPVVKADSLEIPSLGWTQLSAVFDGTGIANGWVTIEKTGGSGSFGAYGVINDNGTSDGSFVFPVAGDLLGSSLTVPVLVETTSGFSSELIVTNRADVPAKLTLSYVENLAPELGSGGEWAITLAPMTQLLIPNAIDYLRGHGVTVGDRRAASYAGTLRVGVSGTGLANVFAGARTAALSPAGGQFGLFTPGIYSGQEARAEVFLYGLRADAQNRTNVAVVNAGTDGSGSVTLQLQAHDGNAGGIARGDPETTVLEPGAWKQFSGFLGSKGVSNGWVHVTHVAGSAPWIAYAVVNDGGGPGARTGDGAYVPMVPGVASGPLGWEISVVPGSDLYAPSLAYDAQGKPAIAYRHRITPPPSSTVEAMLARGVPGSSAWALEKVLSDGMEVDLEFDPVDASPSVAVRTYSVATSPNESIRFSHWTGSAWETSTIEEGPVFYAPKLAFGPDGRPSFCYSSSQGSKELRFVERDGSAWKVQRIDQAGTQYAIDYFSLAYDGAGSPVVAYRKWVEGSDYDFEIRLARRTGSVWETQVVERGWGWGKGLSFALDAAGHPAISHCPGGKAKASDPSLIRWDGSKWDSEVIVPVAYGSDLQSLAFDPTGAPIVAMCHNYHALELARRQPDGQWTIEVIEPNLASCGSTDLRMDPQGRPSVSYQRKGTQDSATSIGFARLVSR